MSRLCIRDWKSKTEIQRSLREDTVLVEYRVVGGGIVTTTITQDRFEIFPITESMESLRTRYELLRFQLTKFNLGPAYVEMFAPTLLEATNEHLHQLYLELIAPIRRMVRGRKSIIFVADGFMRDLPFHALFDGTRYLIDEYEVSYTPCATFSKHSIPCRAPGRGSVLVFGIPDAKAPEILEEVQSIRNIFKDANVFLGENATADNFRKFAKDATLIHIASHSSFCRGHPWRRSLQLADAWLSPLDVMGLRTSSGLVTLSGCGTGMRCGIGGQKWPGLVQGFLNSGARSLVVSLWDVHDRTSAELMKTFYSYLAAGRGRWASLRAALIKLKNSYPHPYYWAPFIGIGALEKNS